MKFKHLLLIILVLSTLVLLFSCGKPQNVEEYTVTFDANGGTEIEAQKIKQGELVTTPEQPERTYYTFMGWYLDGTEWSFLDNTVNDNMTLTAMWELDENQVKEIMEDLLNNKVVKVTHVYKENGEEKSRDGIGLAINIIGGYCYIVTNYHTVNLFENQSESKITVTDCKGNEFEAEVFKPKYKENSAMDSEYDLAAICFPYSGREIQEYANFGAKSNVGDIVFSMGYSSELFSRGEIVDIDVADLNCEVYQHNAISENMPNESLLFNLELQLVGITYRTENGAAYAIFEEKVREFLNNYVYE